MIKRYPHNETFEKHKGLIGMVAKTTCQFMPWEDRMQAGALGLLKALDAFDVGRKIKFSCFATQAIKRAIQRESAGYQIGLAVPAAANEIIKLAKRFQFVEGRTPTGVELKTMTTRSFLAATLQKIITLFCEGPPTYSLDWKAAGSDSGEAEGYSKISHSYLADGKQNVIYENAVTRYILCKAIFSCLNARHRHTIARFYGLDPRGAAQARVIGKDLGITYQAVIQNKDRAIQKLRAYFKQFD